MVKPSPPARCRRIIDIQTLLHFSAIFKESVLYNLDGSDVLSADELMSLFNSTCTSTLDSVAPLRMKRTKALLEPSLNDSTRRQAERRWKKDKLRVSYEILLSRLSDFQKAVKSKFISNLVSYNYHRPQVLFNIFNTHKPP